MRLNWKPFERACLNSDLTFINRFIIVHKIKSIPFYILNNDLSERVIWRLTEFIIKKKEDKFITLLNLYVGTNSEDKFIRLSLIRDEVYLIRLLYYKKWFEYAEDHISSYNDAKCGLRCFKFLYKKKRHYHELISWALFYGHYPIIKYVDENNIDFERNYHDINSVIRVGKQKYFKFIAKHYDGEELVNHIDNDWFEHHNGFKKLKMFVEEIGLFPKLLDCVYNDKAKNYLTTLLEENEPPTYF
jgi:hypothetical protein